MSYYLSELVPTSGLIADYPLDDVVAAGDAALLEDYSTNNRDLDQGTAPKDQFELDVLNGKPGILMSGNNSLGYTGSITVKDMFVVCKYTLAADFGGLYRGLVTGDTSGILLRGDSGASSTKFYNNATGTSTYRKSGVTYAAAAQEAPFTNFELVQYTDTAGVALDGISYGSDRPGFGGDQWRGYSLDLKLYSTVKTEAERRRLNLYYDLKYELFNLNSTTLYFPDPTTTDIGWARFKELPTDWDSVTISHEYEDGGRSFNEISDTPTTTWEIGFTGLSYAQLEIFEAFNKAARRSRSFSLIDKYGVTQTGVRIMRYESDHDAHKSWSNNCSFILAKYP